MHDMRRIREDAEKFDADLARRGLPAMSGSILRVDQDYLAVLQEIEKLRGERNELSARAKKQARAPSTADRDRVVEIRKQLSELEEKSRHLGAEMHNLLSAIPNRLYEQVPEGNDENDNREMRKGGTVREFDFPPREHFELGEALGMMDFDTAAKLSGARFVILRGALARLERALANFMLDIHTQQFGYQEVSVPHLVLPDTVFGTGQLPKFAHDLFQTTDDRWLIPTAEVPLTALGKGRIFEEEELPMRVTAWTPCYRSEAGAAGRDTRGMLRQHQFSKVELVSLTTPERSDEELLRMTSCAESILERLGPGLASHDAMFWGYRLCCCRNVRY